MQGLFCLLLYSPHNAPHCDTEKLIMFVRYEYQPVCHLATAFHVESCAVLSNSVELPDSACATSPYTLEVTNKFCKNNLHIVEYASMHNSHLDLYLIAILEKN